MGKPAKKPEVQKPKIEQPALFVVPDAGKMPKHEALRECSWPIERFKVLEQLTRSFPKKITTAELSLLADVSLADTEEALRYFYQLDLVRIMVVDGIKTYAVRDAGKREYQRVRPLMVRRIAQ